MAELTRHRLASFCIESQRYVSLDGEIPFIHPLCCRDGSTEDEIWRDAMKDAEWTYHSLLRAGCKPQDARKVLPNSTVTRIVMKTNLREWRHILSLRTGKGVYPEMKQ